MKFNELKDKWGDPKEKAKIQLILFLIFIVFAVIFTRLTTNYSDNNDYDNQIGNIINNNDNLDLINNNYNYNINIDITTSNNNKNVTYVGIRYDDKMIISKKIDDNIKNYYMENNDYYVYTDEGYILSNIDEVYDVINYNYLSIENIKEFIKKGIKDGDTYLIKVSNINLDSVSKEYITIEVNSITNGVELNIDYSNLLKNDDIISCKIKYTFTDINKITEADIISQKYIEKK